MLFHDRVKKLCEQHGISISRVLQTLGFSKSIATKWKDPDTWPQNETIKALADHFEMSVEDLLEGVIDYSSYDISGFNRPRFEELLAHFEGSHGKAVKRYLEVEDAQKMDAMNDPDRQAIFQNAHGNVQNVQGSNISHITQHNGKEHPLSDQESELLRIFAALDTVERSRVLVFAAELKEGRR